MIRTHEEPEDGGEGYFASISDLMVGILFIFLLMLAVFAINYANEDKDKEIARLTKLVEDQKKEIDVLKGQVADLIDERDRLRNGISELVKQLEGVSIGLRGEQGRLEGVRRDLLIALQQNLANRDVQVDVDTGQGILRLSSVGLFELDKDEFTLKGRNNARALLEEMAKLLPCYAKASPGSNDCPVRQPIFETILIEGHTDTLRTDRHGGNWTLSTDRARAFLELMLASAPGLNDLQNADNQRLLGLAGYGESRTLRGIAGEDERNRRIETRFLLSGQRENLADRIKRLDDLLLDLKTLAGSRP
jgi:chemotaxis protein MotB